MAASTPAIAPVPMPTTTPQSRTSCQAAVITTVSPEPSATRPSAASTTRRRPKRLIAAAANGPARPYSTRLTETAAEMTVRLQPNSSSSGTISTPGADRKPEAPSSVTKVTPATIQARCGRTHRPARPGLSAGWVARVPAVTELSVC